MRKEQKVNALMVGVLCVAVMMVSPTRVQSQSQSQPSNSDVLKRLATWLNKNPNDTGAKCVKQQLNLTTNNVTPQQLAEIAKAGNAQGQTPIKNALKQCHVKFRKQNK